MAEFKIALRYQTAYASEGEEFAEVNFRRREVAASFAPEEVGLVLYQAQILSFKSTQRKLEGIAQNTAHQVMQVAFSEFLALAQSVGDYVP
jgi:hypothetical protein